MSFDLKVHLSSLKQGVDSSACRLETKSDPSSMEHSII